jgi:hypothetical protein
VLGLVQGGPDDPARRAQRARPLSDASE